MPALDRETCNLTIAVSPAWKDWLTAVSRYTRSNRSTVIDAAVSEFARNRGFDREAPQRCPGREGAS
jgi:hypothetical protein